jgi:hypothetical protein
MTHEVRPKGPNEATMILVSAAITSLSKKFPSERNNENLMFLRDAYSYLNALHKSDSTDLNEVGRIYRRLAEIFNQEADNILDEGHETTIDR